MRNAWILVAAVATAGHPSCLLPAMTSLDPSAGQDVLSSHHRAFTYDQEAFQFVSEVRSAVLGPNETGGLESLRHSTDTDTGRDTVHSRRFYAAISQDSPLRQTYRRFIRHLHSRLFAGENLCVFQSSPSIRIQYPGEAHLWLHTDSDDEGRHPPGEVHFNTAT